MAGSSQPPIVPAEVTPPPARGDHRGVPSRRRVRRLSGRDRIVVLLMVLVPLVLTIGLVWLPAIATVVLSFTSWNGIGGLSTIKWVGTENYVNVFTIYPPFWPAVRIEVAGVVELLLELLQRG